MKSCFENRMVKELQQKKKERQKKKKGRQQTMQTGQQRVTDQRKPMGDGRRRDDESEDDVKVDAKSNQMQKNLMDLTPSSSWMK